MKLASALLARSKSVSRTSVTALESSLREIVARAEHAWPGVRVEPVRFIGYLADRMAQGEPLEAELQALHATDLYVACAASEDAKAIAVLEAAFFHASDATLARMGTDSDFAVEVKQRTREKLFVREGEKPPRIVEYSGRGELKSFLRVVLLREAISLRRKDRRELLPRDDDDARGELATTDPELSHLRRLYAAEFDRAFCDAVVALTSEERNLLRYHYVDRLNIDHIGAICGIHRVSAARRLTRIRAALVERTRAYLAERLRLGGDELESLLRLIESEVDISVGRALHEASIGA